MNHSNIEYIINPDGTKGYAWNFQSGCLNWQNPDICPVGFNCWAKRKAGRFHKNFEPTLHPEKLLDPLRVKKPATIGVCFTGDLFGNWVDPTKQPGAVDFGGLKDEVFWVVKQCPQHRFLFLTKCPWNIKKWGRFPDNAWVGVTACNQKQHNEAVTILAGTDAKHKWISYEPLLEEINLGGAYDLEGIDWVVIGAQTQPRILPKREWVEAILDVCDKGKIPYWTKTNLETWTGEYVCALHQELPFD